MLSLKLHFGDAWPTINQWPVIRPVLDQIPVRQMGEFKSCRPSSQVGFPPIHGTKTKIWERLFYFYYSSRMKQTQRFGIQLRQMFRILSAKIQYHEKCVNKPEKTGLHPLLWGILAGGTMESLGQFFLEYIQNLAGGMSRDSFDSGLQPESGSVCSSMDGYSFVRMVLLAGAS